MREGEGTRARIQQAALRLFVERGVAETGIRDIAQAAGVSEGAMYRHFAGKEALVWHLFSEGFAEFARQLEARAAVASGLPAKAQAMVEGFCALFDADPLRFRFILLVQHGQLAKVTATMPNPSRVVHDVIAEAIGRREIPPGDAELLTAMVIGIILQTATATVYNRIAPPLGALAPALAEACRLVLERRSREDAR
jgi:AcrR family transcriptional regulator